MPDTSCAYSAPAGQSAREIRAYLIPGRDQCGRRQNRMPAFWKLQYIISLPYLLKKEIVKIQMRLGNFLILKTRLLPSMMPMIPAPRRPAAAPARRRNSDPGSLLEAEILA